ncbi:metallophosphoesterase [Neobacillus drentensis]|uniref:metallophosphoesterase n=1 Tax=Neobacillus drentensis TaxID=220684 RepID=UPI002FFDEB9F
MLFILGVILIYNLFLVYIGWNGWKWLQIFGGKKKRVKYVFWVVLTLFAYSFVFGRLVEDSIVLTWVGAIWLGLFYFLLLILPFINLFVYLTRFTRIRKNAAIKWTGNAVIVGIIAFFGFGIYNAYSPVIKSYQLHIDKHVEGKQSLTIVMASDMHFGVLSGANQARKLVKHIDSMEPDLVLFPGDIIDDDVKPYLEGGIPDILRKIKAPVFGSLGNHDRDEDVDLIQVFNSSGMKLLADETIILDNGITLIGRKDRGYQDVTRAKLSELMDGVDLSKPVILLEHQPYDLDIAEKNGVDLILSGHTHRGQIAPMNLITNMIYENDWGYLKKGTLQSIVSSGYGFWGTPIRIGTRSEIVQLKVTFNP